MATTYTNKTHARSAAVTAENKIISNANKQSNDIENKNKKQKTSRFCKKSHQKISISDDVSIQILQKNISIAKKNLQKNKIYKNFDFVYDLATNYVEQGFFNVDINPLSTETISSIEAVYTRISNRVVDDIKNVGGLISTGVNITMMVTIITGVVLAIVSLRKEIGGLWTFFCAQLRILFTLPGELLDYITSFFAKPMVPQSLEFDPALCSLVSILLGLVTSETINLKKLLSMTKDLKRSSEGIKSVADLALRIIQTAVKTIKKYLFGDEHAFDIEVAETDVQTFITYVRDWAIKLAKLKGQPDDIVSGFMNKANFEALTSLLVVGHKLTHEYALTNKDYAIDIKAALRVSLTELKSIIAIFEKNGFGAAHLRPKPLTILLKGKSGVGKSAMSAPFLNRVLVGTAKSLEEITRIKECIDNYIYSRAPETDFWDGYHGQKAVVYDDFMQSNEMSANALQMEAFEIIRASNVFPYLLHKAHLEDKGNSYFNSRIILCSTNNWDLRTEALREHEALVRRFDVVAEIYPKLEFCREGTGNAALKDRRLMELPSFTTDVYEIHLTHPTQKVMNFEEFVQFACVRYNMNDEQGDSYLHAVKDLKDESIVNKAAELKDEEVFFDTLFEEQGFFSDTYNHFSDYMYARKIDKKFPIDTKMFIKCRKYVRANFDKFFVPIKGNERIFTQWATDLMFQHADDKYIVNCFETDIIDEYYLVKLNRSTVPAALINKCYDELVSNFKALMPEEAMRPQSLYGYDDPYTFNIKFKNLLCYANLDEDLFFTVCKDKEFLYLSYTYSKMCKRMKSVRELKQFSSLIAEFFNKKFAHSFSQKEIANMWFSFLWVAQSLDHADMERLFVEAREQIQNEENCLSKIQDSFDFLRHKVCKAFIKAKADVEAFFSKYPIFVWLSVLLPIVVGAYYMFSEPKQVEQTYSGFKGASKPGKSLKTHIRQLGVNMRMQAQDGVEERVQNMATAVLKNNTYIMVNHKDQMVCTITAIKDTIFMMNSHTTKIAKKLEDSFRGESFKCIPLISYMNNVETGIFMLQYSFVSNIKITVEQMQSDVTFFDVGRVCRQHRDISKNFIKDEQLAQFEKYMPIALGLVRGDDEKEFQVYSTKAKATPITISTQGKDLPRWIYNISTQAGECGSFAFVNDPFIQNCILGIHAIGNGFSGGCVAVTQETIASNLETFEPQGLDYTPIDDEEIYEYCGHRVIGSVSRAPHTARKTKLRKSLMYDCMGGSLRAPAILTPVNGVDPFDLALKRYSTPNYIPRLEPVRAAAINYGEKLNSLPFKNKSILNFEEAVAGIHGNPYVNGIPRGTSAGYPWCLNVFNGKKAFFGSDGDYEFDSTHCISLKKKVDEIHSSISRGEPCSALFMDSMKDELRPHSKIAKLSTRMISCAPLDYVIVCRQYFGAFCAFFMENKIYSGGAVGINPFSKDWTNLANYVGGQNANIIAGDFSAFDSSQNNTILFEICDIINRWYGDGKEVERLALFEDLVRSKHVHGKYVVEFSHCLPSGHPLTSIVNTMYVNIAFRTCWIHINNGILSSIDSFDDHVKLVAYGDDNIAGVSSEAIKLGFNYAGIIQAMVMVGLTYTSENKEEEITFDYKSINDCTFLKRAFLFNWENGMYYAPLDLDVVLEMPYWYRNGVNVPQRQCDNLQNCFRELSIHGESVFDTYAPLYMSEAYKYRDVLPMSFVLYPHQYYVEKAYEAWIDPESLVDVDDNSNIDSNVSDLGTDESLVIADQCDELSAGF